MSNGEVAFLALVLVAFASFVGIVGFISIWSRFPAGTRVRQAENIPRAWPEQRAESASVERLVARPSQAA